MKVLKLAVAITMKLFGSTFINLNEPINSYLCNKLLKVHSYILRVRLPEKNKIINNVDRKQYEDPLQQHGNGHARFPTCNVNIITHKHIK